jgi:hypothetical protein
MGVDVGYRIKFFSVKHEEITSIKVGDQVNSFDSLFNVNNETVSSTSIPFNITEVIKEGEDNVFIFEDLDEMLMSTKIFSPEAGLKILERIHLLIFFKKSYICLISDLSKIDNLILTDSDKKLNRKKTTIQDYFEFYTSLSIVIGILKTAKELGYLVQFEAEYY